jgi:FMN-dependent NADH-azoreductase
MGEASISRRLTAELARRWRSAHPKGKVIYRDVTGTAIPVITAAWVAANYTPKESRTQEQHDLLALSTELVAELLEADEYVIGVPMHNWGPSSSFKLWIDQILRFGDIIALTADGPKGMLRNKRATFVIAAGRRYGPGSDDAPRNYLEPWLRTFFGYLGLRDMRFLLADGAADVRYGKIEQAAFLAPHIRTIETLAERWNTPDEKGSIAHTPDGNSLERSRSAGAGFERLARGGV